MTKPVTIPNTFATATTAIPLSQLDSDFSTVATALNDANTYSNYAADTGVANAYVVTLTGVSTTYSAGLRIQFKAGNANTGASTLNVNSGGTKNITFQDASALSSGTIAANAIVDVMYDGTQFLLMNDPAGTVGTGDVVGPAGATANAAAIFDSTTGKLIKDSKVIITPVANSSTLTIANNKTVTVNNTLTLSGTDSTTMTFPSTNATIARTDAAQTFTGTQTFSSDASVNGLTVGRGAGAVSTNTAVGASALSSNTSGSLNTGVGYQSLISNLAGANNTAVGYQSGYGVSSGASNTFVGDNAGASVTSGSFNTAVGRQAGSANAGSTGSNNSSLGYQALYSNTTASSNTAVGYQAGYSNTTGISNTNFGYQAGYLNQTGQYNSFFGYQAGYTSAAGAGVNAFNTALGTQSGYGLTTGVKNTLVGYLAGEKITTGSSNTVFGGYNGNQDGLDIRTASNYAVISDGDGNRLLSTANGYSLALDGGAVPQTGTGITFPATQSASSNANTLDDYEEGTFTPTIIYSGTNTPSYINQSGRYTKVGRLVTVDIFLNFDENGSTGNITIGALPFTSINSLPRTTAAVFSFGLTGLPTAVSICAYLTANSTTMTPFVNDNAATQLSATYTDNDQDIYLSFTYTSA